MLFDSHCHLQFLKENKRKQIIGKMVQENIGAVCVGTSANDWDKTIQICQQYPNNIFFAFGIHPEPEENPKSQTELSDQLLSLEIKFNKLGTDFIKAVGETGLEFFYEKTQSGRERQKWLFIQHIVLAKKYQKPLIIHCREAYKEVYEILRAEKVESFVMHFFTGTKEQAKRFLDLGGFISFSSVIVITDDYDDLVRFVPQERMLLETDSPFVRSNTPLEVQKVYQKVAELKEIGYDGLTKQVAENVKNFFGINW